MASYTTSFPSWSGFEALLSAAQGFEATPTYTSIKNSLTSLLNHASASYTVLSSSSSFLSIAYGDGVTAQISGFNFGPSSGTITSINISNGSSTINMSGFVDAQTLSGSFSSYSYSYAPAGYFESGSGQIPVNGASILLNNWSQTIPTALGNVVLAASGSSVLAGDSVTNVYNTVSVTDNAGHSAQITGLNYYLVGNATSATDYVQVLHDMLSGNDSASNNNGPQEMRTFAGDDTLSSFDGADTMVGGTGNDTYFVDSVDDVVIELPGEGNDTIQSSVTYTLPASVENLTLIGFDIVSALARATGNELNNVLTGNNGDNAMFGNGGNDTLIGGGGNDSLDGGAGIDTVVLNGPRINYTLIPMAGGWKISGPEGLDEVTGAEFAQFTDQTISLGNYPPTGAVTILGAAAERQTLFVVNTLSDPNGVGSISYQWNANGSPIGGATTNGLTLTQALVGKTISVTASYTDQQGYAEAVTSDATAPVVGVNSPPTVGTFGNQGAKVNKAVSISLGMLFSDPDGDVLSFAATGLPAGLSIDNGGTITGTAPDTTGTHHIKVTATDPGNASATLNFDLVITSDHTLTANVVTRGGLALPGVTAFEFASETALGSLYGYRNISLDTDGGSGVRTLSADLVATGSSATGALDLTFHLNSGAGFTSFDLTGPVTAANHWTIVTNSSVANSYGLSAIHISESIAANTVIGKLSVTLPATAPGSSIIDLTDATLGNDSSPARGLAYSKLDLGALAQLNATLPDSNVAIALERDTSDLVVAGRKPITAADALDALKLSVNLASSQGSSWKELIAADMNHDGRVTAADALEILKASVGINTVQPSWVFVPNDAAVNPNLGAMTRTSVSYHDELNLASLTAPTSATITGILVGDVNNSWTIPT